MPDTAPDRAETCPTCGWPRGDTVRSSRLEKCPSCGDWRPVGHGTSGFLPPDPAPTPQATPKPDVAEALELLPSQYFATYAGEEGLYWLVRPSTHEGITAFFLNRADAEVFTAAFATRKPQSDEVAEALKHKVGEHIHNLKSTWGVWFPKEQWSVIEAALTASTEQAAVVAQLVEAADFIVSRVKLGSVDGSLLMPKLIASYEAAKQVALTEDTDSEED